MAAIKKIFTIMGVPKILQSDNGGEFKNSILDQYLSKINVRHIFGSPYHPQSQVVYKHTKGQFKIFLFLQKMQWVKIWFKRCYKWVSCLL